MSDSFDYLADRFADIQVLRYRVPGFEELPLKQKKLIYFLYEAALSGRDIIWDQNYKENLKIRHCLEAVFRHYKGDRDTAQWRKFETYMHRVWFANGIHHHYGNYKFKPDMGQQAFADFALNTPMDAFTFDYEDDVNKMVEWLASIERQLYHRHIATKRVNKDADDDLVETSSVNYYEDLTQARVEEYYRKITRNSGPRDVSHGLNSKLVSTNSDTIEERVWKVGGMYGEALERIVGWLEKAADVAENAQQEQALRHLIDYYNTGDLACFDAYNIAWVKDTQSSVDTINGFIETYNDPMDYRGAFEAMVSVKDPIATRRIETIAQNAQWFEDNSPIDDAFKKREVKGITGSVINVVVESGDASPATPIGINLPNADWIREEHGSKSVNLANIVEAYNKVKGTLWDEFAPGEEQLARIEKWGDLADNLHTDLHEVIGHASGRLAEGIATPKETLKNYSSTLEEARADLVALYYMMDPKLIDLGLMPSLDVGKAAYDDFMTNGLMLQLRRLELGEQLEEDHMRNRQLIARWALGHGKPKKTVVLKQVDGKTRVVINDYVELRDLFRRLLVEVQRVKSEGDYEAGQHLVERYGIEVDEKLHAEVLERFAKLNMAPYFGFLNPILTPHYDEAGEITDVAIDYADSFAEQMLYYADNYSFLPEEN